MKFCGITFIVIALAAHSIQGCQFYPPGEYLRFVRVPENLKVGKEVLRIDVHPKRNLILQPVDKEEDVHYFTYRDVNRTSVSLLLARSLEDLVDTDNPRNVLKFRVMCDYDDGEDVITSSLSVTVYVEDLNDHSPIFEGAPYFVTVDELTPVGLTVYRHIKASDRDKPNTPNSDVQYAIIAGNERGKFALDSSHRPFLLLNKPVDYDGGDREFILTITASDRGLPPRSTNATVTILIQDNDDLGPKFTKGVYRTKIKEFYPLTGERIHQIIKFEPPIYAFDQDLGLDSPIRYDILAGNDRHLFYLDHVNGSLFLEREIDLDSERSLPGNTFVLQIQASQIDNPMKTGVARVEIEMMDLNDNLPEFEVDFYNISIVENLPNGFSVLQIIATDQDQGDNSEFTYQLEDQSGAFALDSRTGWLTVRDQNVLDREKRSTITMRVYAKEKTASVVSNIVGASFAGIEVTLLDANDNNPTFIPNNVYDFSILATSKISDTVGQIHAIDPDLGKNGLVVYSLQMTGNKSIPFRVDYKTGHITVSRTPIAVGRHLLFVEASDQPMNPSEKRLSLAVVTVDVKKNISKDLPDFIGAPYEFWVGGNVGIGTSVGQIRVTEFPEKRKLTYDLLHSYQEGVPFAVEERSGTITIVDDLTNYERYVYDFEGVASHGKDINLVTNVTIHVVDFKEEGNILMKGNGSEPIELYVKENAPNTLIGQLISNNNISQNAKYLKFFIANQRDVTDQIKIYSNGSLYTQKALDRETRNVYRLTIISEYNKGLASRTGIFQVTVYVIDENDNPPKFERDYYEGKIKENCVSGTEVDLNYPIYATDVDFGINAQFTITIFGDGSEKFRLDRNNGKIYFNSADAPLDREQKNVYNLRIVAKDKGGLYSEVKLKINVEDENDNPPNFIEMIVNPNSGVEVIKYDQNKIESKNMTSGVYALSQSHQKRNKNKMSPQISLPEDIDVGMKFIKLRADDKDYGENSIIKYEMFSETYIPNEKSLDPFHITQYFMVNPISGDVTVARTLPPESEFRLNISASDSGGLKDYISVKIFIKDVNDHPPVFKKSWYSFDVEESSYSKRFLGRIEATDSDFGSNANISYKIKSHDGEELPFIISEHTGVLNVNGILDREAKDKYSFIVIANDNPKIGNMLSSSVNVDVNILDINDNPPIFYGYDDVLHLPDIDPNLNIPKDIPIYYATVPENTPIGTPITRVYANDTDYVGNGNGLLLFDIPYRKNKENYFSVDSKEGIVTTISKLDYEIDKMHNITIVASDLGSPSLSSTVLLVVNVIDVPEDIKNIEHPVFAHRYYEVEVEENVPVPLKLLDLNVTEPYRNHKLRYSIVTNNKESEIKEMFKVDAKNGTLFIIKSPDREKRALYELRIRLDQYKVGRDMTVMVYPVTNEKLGDLGLNEVKVIVRVIDVNDNVPKFTITGRPIIAAIPTSANFGHHIIRLQAKDPDLGVNGEVRYQILGRADGEFRRFAIDPITGQVRAIASFSNDAGKVYGFDVKATDRRGADDGKSSIANVFVYVLDEQKELVIVMGSKPTDIEKNMENITLALYNVTGLDVRIRKLQPHFNRNQIDNTATDLYLYAVDPILNVVIDMDHLQKAIRSKQTEIEHQLDGHRVLAIASGSIERVHSKNQKVLLSTLEVGVVILGCVVFIGAFITAICVVCVRKRKRRMLQKNYSHTQPLSYTLASSVLSKPPLFPSSYGGDGLRYGGDPVDMEPSRIGFHQQHDVNCPRYPLRRFQTRERSRSTGGIETSITSLHSSGHDSGIVDSTIQCQCGQTTSPSSEDSSNSYEDSLKSLPNRKARMSATRQDSVIQSTRNILDRRSNQRSFPDDLMLRSSGIHRLPPHTHLTPGSGLNHNHYFGRSSERLVMACPLNP